MPNSNHPRFLSWCLLAALASCAEPGAPDDLTEPDDDATVVTGLVEMPGGVTELTYAVVDGVARIDDMLLGDAAAIAARSDELARAARGPANAVGITANDNLWPVVNGKVDLPYDFAPDVNSTMRSRVNAAAAHWNASTLVNIRPRVVGVDANWVRVSNGPENCSAALGRRNTGLQAMTLSSGCSTGSIIHEFGHSLGLLHEHQRADRNSHVIINFNNILGGPTGTAATVNFAIGAAGTPTADLKNYDFTSIMHYPSFAFTGNGLPTITTLTGATFDANRTALSWGDRSAIVALYHYRDVAAMRLRVASSNKCLDMPPDASLGREEGWSLVQQFSCHTGDNQKWHYYAWGNDSSQGLLINGASKLCLTASGGSPGRVKESPCTGSTAQRWALWDVGSRIRNIATGRCLDVEGGSSVTADQTPVNNFSCHGGSNQQWNPF